MDWKLTKYEKPANADTVIIQQELADETMRITAAYWDEQFQWIGFDCGLIEADGPVIAWAPLPNPLPSHRLSSLAASYIERDRK